MTLSAVLVGSGRMQVGWLSRAKARWWSAAIATSGLHLDVASRPRSATQIATQMGGACVARGRRP